MKKKAKAHAPGVWRRVQLDDRFSREKLDEAFNELKDLRTQPPISFKTRVLLLQLLHLILDQRDPRVNVPVWLIAMVARAVRSREKIKVKEAVHAAIKVIAPEKDNQRFQELVSKAYRQIGRNKNAAAQYLLPPTEDLIDYYVTEFRKHL